MYCVPVVRFEQEIKYITNHKKEQSINTLNAYVGAKKWFLNTFYSKTPPLIIKCKLCRENSPGIAAKFDKSCLPLPTDTSR